MTTTALSIRTLRAAAAKFDDYDFIEGASSIELALRKPPLTISITVPLEVFEWYVDVTEPSTRLEAHDWYDYAGYESKRDEDLDREMAQDLAEFLGNILERPLRMRASGNKSRAV